MLLGLREKKREQGKTEDIRRAMEQWQEAERYFKSVSDTDLVDYAVFEMEAARRKYMLLLKRYAEERKYGEKKEIMPETLIMFGIGILMVWVICKIFAWPLKILFKLVINAVMGAIVLLVINIIGSAVGFTLPITALTALLVGLLGVPGVVLIALWAFLM